MKIAKMEIKLILALMLLGYDYELVNESGKYPDTLPEPDRNDIIKVSSDLLFIWEPPTLMPSNRRGRWGNFAI